MTAIHHHFLVVIMFALLGPDARAEASFELEAARRAYARARERVQNEGDQADAATRRRLEVLRNDLAHREESEKIPLNQRTPLPASVEAAPPAFRPATIVQTRAGAADGGLRHLQIIDRAPLGYLQVIDGEGQSRFVHYSAVELPVDEKNGVRAGDQVAFRGIKAKVNAVFADGSVVVDAPRAADGTARLGRALNPSEFTRVRAPLGPSLLESASNFVARGVRSFRGGGVGSSLGSVTQGVSLLGMGVENTIDQAVTRGVCPTLSRSSPATFARLLTEDLSRVKAVMRACADQKTPIDFGPELGPTKSAAKVGFARVTCDRHGDVRVVHTNGVTSEVHFSAPDQIASIAANASDDDRLRLSYQTTEPAGDPPWRVRSELRTKAGVDRRDESFASFANRQYCLYNHCPVDQLIASVDQADDTMTASSPFGAFQTKRVADVAGALMQTRRALIAAGFGVGTFAQTCAALGARDVPPAGEVIFTAAPGTGPAAPTDAPRAGSAGGAR